MVRIYEVAYFREILIAELRIYVANVLPPVEVMLSVHMCVADVLM